jgi:hypothetical protein
MREGLDWRVGGMVSDMIHSRGGLDQLKSSVGGAHSRRIHLEEQEEEQ